MIKLNLDEVITALRGEVKRAVKPVSVSGVSTDSRSIQLGELFFALNGENFNGHQYVTDAAIRGAVGAVINRAQYESVFRALVGNSPGDFALILVDDPLRALGRLAHFHRTQVSAEVIAVAGSNGKTTTKGMIDHVLRTHRVGRAAPRSFNNAIGVPLTLLSVTGKDEYVVVEIGTNHPGEIAELARIAEPDLAVITSIDEEHLEGLGDLAGVAREEYSLLSFVRKGGFAALSADAPFVRENKILEQGICVSFGRAADADLRVSDIRYEHPIQRFRVNERFDYALQLPGAHNACNAAGAIAVARRLGMEHDAIAQALRTFAAPAQRSHLVDVGGVMVLDDSYNANPGSVVAAIESFQTIPSHGRKFAVLGEMRELGPRSAELHRQIARRAAQAQFHRVFLVGDVDGFVGADDESLGLFRHGIECCADLDACRDRLLDEIRPGDALLLKASRAVRLERLLQSLRDALDAAPAS
ncbi:MAG: UDP-N-acetylmuramoyl-tripeptide--D-alanyl-D-alanine ligase [Phycisphaerae bacterium]